MFRPPLDPRDRPLTDEPTRRNVVVSYALVAAVPLLLWAVSYPLASVVAFGTIAGLFTGGRRAYRLIRCFHDCQRFAFDLGGTARITVTNIRVDDAN